jgi:hypothetical protein
VYQVLWSLPFCCTGYSVRRGFMLATHLLPEAADNRDVEKVRLASVIKSHTCLDMSSLSHMDQYSGLLAPRQSTQMHRAPSPSGQITRRQVLESIRTSVKAQRLARKSATPPAPQIPTPQPQPQPQVRFLSLR